MTFDPLPKWAAWRHTGLRDGFEVAFLRKDENGYLFEGHTTALEEGHPWTVRYRIELDPDWLTRSAEVTAWTRVGESRVHIQTNGAGGWSVNGVHRPELYGCRDVDLESSALTNMIPVHRHALPVGGEVGAPAAYVRAVDVRVERLEQRYTRRRDESVLEFDYEAPQFEFRCRLRYDSAGLVVDYPGIASRVQ